MIPTRINNYNVYHEGNKLLGMGEELTLPDFEMVSESISGAGILGEIEDPTIGYFSNQEMEIPFRVLDQEAVDLMDVTKALHLEIRGAEQALAGVGDPEYCSVRVVVRGRCKKFSPGKLKRGSAMETKITISILYILIELDGKCVLELDKLNEIYKINGKDVLAKIKEMC